MNKCVLGRPSGDDAEAMLRKKTAITRDAEGKEIVIPIVEDIEEIADEDAEEASATDESSDTSDDDAHVSKNLMMAADTHETGIQNHNYNFNIGSS